METERIVRLFRNGRNQRKSGGGVTGGGTC